MCNSRKLFNLNAIINLIANNFKEFKFLSVEIADYWEVDYSTINWYILLMDKLNVFLYLPP